MGNPLFLQGLFFQKLSMKHILSHKVSHIEKAISSLQDTCRYHGARRNILKVTEHSNYKHGNRTKESMATYNNKVAELDHLEAIAHSVGIMEGPKRAGRKPKIKLKK